MTDQELMQAIKVKYGTFIDEAVEGTAFPASLVAALVANESGLNESAARFEPAVFGQLAFVITGRKANFGSIGAQDLAEWLGRVSMEKYGAPVAPGEGRTGDQSPSRLSPQAAVILALQNLATSWGPTQIMGYQALAGHYELGELPNLQRHFVRCVGMLDAFQKQFHLPTTALVGAVWDGYFHCWNTGRPDGQTFDPNYAANGLRRMAIYEAL